MQVPMALLGQAAHLQDIVTAMVELGPLLYRGSRFSLCQWHHSQLLPSCCLTYDMKYTDVSQHGIEVVANRDYDPKLDPLLGNNS